MSKNKSRSSDKETQKRKEHRPFLIVGLGASAGGLAAFQQFFLNMPPQTEMAFVLVQHLDPTHKSLLSELLRNYTQMQVIEVRDNMEVVPGTIYTIPPNKEMGILNGRLLLTPPHQDRGYQRTIDYFFRSLAEDQKENAVGIVLSGSGSEGAIGIQAIKGEGGLALAQYPQSAQYDAMPRNAIASKAVDAVLPVEKMPEYLLQYMRNRKVEPITDTERELIAPRQNTLQKILLLLRNRTGNDFTHYKMNTINRRIDKRMAINQIDKLENYLKYLMQTPAEAKFLSRELLIGVTSFYRDKKAFEVIKNTIIPKIIDRKPENETIRIWVPGCSTGEEAYSLALHVDEVLTEKRKKTSFQVFASDIDDEAITFARQATYPKSIASDVGIERFNRYFDVEEDRCKVKKHIREKVIFAVHNLISDTPFSRLDLISCRNVLIYLNSSTQDRIFPIFHYSLNPDGYLLLGTSETIGHFNDLFSAVDRKNKIFIRKPALIRPRPILDIPSSIIEKSTSFKLQPIIPAKAPGIKLNELIEKLLLKNYAPPCVIIDHKDMALYFYGNTGQYLQPSSGEASFNIVDMARSGLKTPLRSTINEVRKTHQEAFHRALKVKTNGGYQLIDLKLMPLHQQETGEALILVIFEDIDSQKSVLIEEKTTEGPDLTKILELEHELTFAKESLRTTIEELEITNEELMSANEELQSANEELQSTNEELETSKEELQSVNEEMITVNTELQIKIDELALAHDDLANLLASTEVGTIFLNSKLEIKRFTPSITKVFNLIQSDIDRPISHITSNLIYDNLEKDARKVFQELKIIKKTVKSKRGEWFHMQITPYRTDKNVVDGVVITFVDISEEKRMEEELKKSNEHLSLALEALNAVPFVCTITNGLEFLFVGENVKRTLGFTSSNFTSNPDFWTERIHPDDRKRVLDSFNQLQVDGSINYQFRWKFSDEAFKDINSYIRLIESRDKEEENYVVGIWQ